MEYIQKIISLLDKLDEHKLKCVYQFIIGLMD